MATPGRPVAGQSLLRLAPSELDAALERLAAQRGDPPAYRLGLLELLLRLTGAAGAAWVSARIDGGHDVGPTLLGTPLQGLVSDADLARVAADALRQGRFTEAPGLRPGPLLAAAPCAGGSAALVLASAAAEAASAGVLLQWLARWTDAYGTGAALLAGSDSLAEALSTLAGSLAAQAPSSAVFVGTLRRGRQHHDLAAHTEAGGFDQRSDTAREVATLFGLAADGPLAWPGASGAAAPTLASLAARLQAGAIRVVVVPGSGRGLQALAACVVSGAGHSRLSAAALTEQLRAAEAVLSLRLDGFPGRAGRKKDGGRSRALPATVLLAALAGLVPVTDSIGTDAVLEPATQRIVSTPFEAALEAVLVRAGDTVQAGQPLLRLDGRALELERQGLLAERDQLRQREAASRAAGDLQAAMLIRLAIDKAQARIEVAGQHLERLQLRSPIDGIVLSADLHKEQGRMLQMGQALMEIAPKSPLIAELHIPVADIHRFAEGARVRLGPAGGGERLDGVIARIRPRARSGEGGTWFVAEVPVDNTAARLRPGTPARARIAGRRTLLGWRLLRAPVEALRQWLVL